MHGQEAKAHSPLSVPRWTDLLSGMQARHPRAWRGLGNLESRMLGERLEAVRIEKPVYITGLARSGTTILLELLARHPDFATHRYRDFPPVLAPWAWNWFIDRAGSGSDGASERAHGDGITVTPESPEAFEEVIWMAFFPGLHDPEASAVLGADTGNVAFETFYRDHIRKLLLIRGGRRYLSKANYNLTRLGYLLEIFPDARFIVPFREPVRHIASLMRQHRRFCREHTRDARLQRHMSRSGHFEFGLDRRPINSGDMEAAARVRDLWAGHRDVEGWALYWSDLHGHVANSLETDPAIRDATLLVDYETLCARPESVMTAIVEHCELPSSGIDLAAEARNTIREPSYYEPDFSDEEIGLITSTTASVRERLQALSGT